MVALYQTYMAQVLSHYIVFFCFLRLLSIFAIKYKNSKINLLAHIGVLLLHPDISCSATHAARVVPTSSLIPSTYVARQHFWIVQMLPIHS